ALQQINARDPNGRVIDKLVPLLLRAENADSENPKCDGCRPVPEYDDTRKTTVTELLQKITATDRSGDLIDKLVPLLGNPDGSVRTAAAAALGLIPARDRSGAVIDRLLPVLGDPDANVREAAASALGHIPNDDHVDSIIDRLLPLVGDRDV